MFDMCFRDADIVVDLKEARNYYLHPVDELYFKFAADKGDYLFF